jgi:hypothetical protein
VAHRAPPRDKATLAQIEAYRLLLRHFSHAHRYFRLVDDYDPVIDRREVPDLARRADFCRETSERNLFNVLTAHNAVVRQNCGNSGSFRPPLSTTGTPLSLHLQLQLLYHHPIAGDPARARVLEPLTNHVETWFVAQYAGQAIPLGDTPRPYDASNTVALLKSHVHPLGSTMLCTMMPHFTPPVDFGTEEFFRFSAQLERHQR